MRPSKYQNNNTESVMGVQTSYICFWIGPFFFLIFRKTGRHLFLQCFKFGKAMYIIRNKIRVICSKIMVGMEGGGGPFSLGGGPYFTGEYGPPGPYSMGVHIRSHTGTDLDGWAPPPSPRSPHPGSATGIFRTRPCYALPLERYGGNALIFFLSHQTIYFISKNHTRKV